MGRPGYPVDDLVRFLADRPPPTDEPAATGFREATFSAIFKSAGLRSTGAWRVILEVPSAEAEAFFPVRKAFELELTCTVRRKSTEGPGQEGTSEEGASQEAGRPKASSRKRPGGRRRAGAA
jgi:hypothetical protein